MAIGQVMIMRYAQIKSGKKLHLVFEAEGKVSQPVCGRRVEDYRMSCNLPLGNACKNCLRIYNINQGVKIQKEFYKSFTGD